MSDEIDAGDVQFSSLRIHTVGVCVLSWNCVIDSATVRHGDVWLAHERISYAFSCDEDTKTVESK